VISPFTDVSHPSRVLFGPGTLRDLGFAPAAPDAMRGVARASGVRDPAGGLSHPYLTLGVPVSLRELGTPESGIESDAEQAVQGNYRYLRPAARHAAQAMLAHARGNSPPRAF